ncbi:Hypothetical predicted protein [Podarcis lilfordi]|uniref:Uncharacterized protein n=1 Tax=Podarcis lilfordi TaxID=74358 RepID=A0AA35K9J5_9SAUR|nr:Hypothetical predicted protein [Podarcis lilfordi]
MVVGGGRSVRVSVVGGGFGLIPEAPSNQRRPGGRRVKEPRGASARFPRTSFQRRSSGLSRERGRDALGLPEPVGAFSGVKPPLWSAGLLRSGSCSFEQTPPESLRGNRGSFMVWGFRSEKCPATWHWSPGSCDKDKTASPQQEEEQRWQDQVDSCNACLPLIVQLERHEFKSQRRLVRMRRPRTPCFVLTFLLSSKCTVTRRRQGQCRGSSV